MIELQTNLEYRYEEEKYSPNSFTHKGQSSRVTLYAYKSSKEGLKAVIIILKSRKHRFSNYDIRRHLTYTMSGLTLSLSLMPVKRRRKFISPVT